MWDPLFGTGGRNGVRRRLGQEAEWRVEAKCWWCPWGWIHCNLSLLQTLLESKLRLKVAQLYPQNLVAHWLWPAQHGLVPPSPICFNRDFVRPRTMAFSWWKTFSKTRECDLNSLGTWGLLDRNTQSRLNSPSAPWSTKPLPRAKLGS